VGIRLVITTCPVDRAEEIVRPLVEEHWVACANILPAATSVYFWEGRVQRDEESVVLLKTRDDLLEGLKRRLGEVHPYDVPELLAFEVDDGLPSYLEWVREVTRSGAEEGA